MMLMISKTIFNYRHESQGMRYESACFCFHARIDGIIGTDSNPDR